MGNFVAENHDAINATAAVLVAAFTFTLWRSTARLWKVAAKQADTLQQSTTEARDAIKAVQASANAARQAVDIAERSLIASDRPWIAVRLKISEGIPLVFAAGKIEAKITLTAQNIGKSPATNIECFVEIHPTIIEADQRTNQIALRGAPPALHNFGRVLFPEEQFTEEHTVVTSIVEFKERIAEMAAEAKDTHEWVFEDQGRPAVVGIVWYRLPSGRRPRHTIMLGEINNVDPEQYGFDGSEGEFSNVEIIESFVSGRVT